MKRLLFIHITHARFVRTDIETLSEQHDVRSFQFKENGIWTAFSFFKLFFFLLSKLSRSSGVIIAFGGYHSGLAVWMSKRFEVPTAVICHGTDCCSLPSINYGRFRKGMMSRFLAYSYRHTQLILPVSESLCRVSNSYHLDVAEAPQGILHYMPGLKTPMHVIPNGLNTSFWSIDSSIGRRTKTAITVTSAMRLQLKGIDLIADTALQLPDWSFEIIGIDTPSERSWPSNMHFLGRKDKESLKAIYNSTAVYLQLSLWEGFGLSLCEAMLCGATPVVSAVNALPDIVGASGHVIKRHEAVDVAEVLSQCTSLADHNEEAREKILMRFDAEKRKLNLKEVLSETFFSTSND